MNSKKLAKYVIRFLVLLTSLTYFINYYFNNFLIPKNDLFPDLQGYTFRDQINNNLLEDANRFFPFIDIELIRLNIVIAIFIFIFLVFLYSTKFYTYVNELTYSLDRNYLDEYLSIYLTWTTSLLAFVTVFRFANLISRKYLILLTFIVPILLLIFRNTEYVSSLLGRSVTDENFITINLKEDSVFRNLRIMTFRKDIKSFDNIDLTNFEQVSSIIDKLNKVSNINLIVINFEDNNLINTKLEEYLINLNKKILLISKNKMKFNSLFISRDSKINNYFLTYFNNDIQYGSKYILKRILDIVISIIAIAVLSPLMLIIYLYIYFLDGTQVVIKQSRVGLHGIKFNMYKFRTMKKGSHELREELSEFNKNDKAIFKLENDPRVLKGAEFLRKFSLDELPQLFNIFKGEMSLVGPRPLFEEDTLLFNKLYMRRLNVLPGLTGLLQINERNTSDFSIWYKYDMEYIDNWSLILDLKIILKTPLALLTKNISGK